MHAESEAVITRPGFINTSLAAPGMPATILLGLWRLGHLPPLSAAVSRVPGRLYVGSRSPAGVSPAPAPAPSPACPTALTFFLNSRPTASGHTVNCYFCRVCGTRVIHSTPGKSVVSVKGGCIEGLDWAKAKHIWVKRAMVPIPVSFSFGFCSEGVEVVWGGRE